MRGAVRHTKTASGRRDGGELDELYARGRDRIASAGRHAGAATSPATVGRRARRAATVAAVGFRRGQAALARESLDGYLNHAASFYRAPQGLVRQRVEVRFDRDVVWRERPGENGRALRAQLPRRDLASGAPGAS